MFIYKFIIILYVYSSDWRSGTFFSVVAFSGGDGGVAFLLCAGHTHIYVFVYICCFFFLFVIQPDLNVKTSMRSMLLCTVISFVHTDRM